MHIEASKELYKCYLYTTWMYLTILKNTLGELTALHAADPTHCAHLDSAPYLMEPPSASCSDWGLWTVCDVPLAIAPLLHIPAASSEVITLALCTASPSIFLLIHSTQAFVLPSSCKGHQ